MKYIIMSEIVNIRHWTNDDIPHLIQMNQDKFVMKYFLSTLTAEETTLRYKLMQEHIEKNGFGLYVVENSIGEFLGYTGYMIADFESSFTPCIEIGWRFKKEYWGNGYATAAAKLCLTFGFSELSFESIYSFTSIHNKKSEAVMQRIGMQKIGEFNHPRVPPEHFLNRHVVYKIDKNQFANSFIQ